MTRFRSNRWKAFALLFPIVGMAAAMALAQGPGSQRAFFQALWASSAKFANAPRSIENLEIWLDLSDQSTITVTSNLISIIADKSGNGRDATQTNTAYQASYTNTQNGLKVATFSADYYTGQYDLTVTQQTTFAVFKRNGESSFARVFTMAEQTANDYDSGGYIPIVRNASTDQYASYVRPSFIAGLNTDTNNYTLFISSHSGTSIQNYNYANTATDSAPTLNKAFKRYAVGVTLESTPSTSQIFSGNIAEILVYSRALSEEERNFVYTYLVNKWGI